MLVRPVQLHEVGILSRIAAETFRQSHGSSTTSANIETYIAAQYTENLFQLALQEPSPHYYFLEEEQNVLGYLHIMPNQKHPMLSEQSVCKLDRIYLLENTLCKGAGYFLFQFAKQLALNEKQVGFWLNVWEGNTRAIRFYQQLGFQEIGKTDFQISPTHSNPNLVLFLKFD